MPDFGNTLDAFRADARDWLAANFPPSLSGSTGGGERLEALTPERDSWRKAMGDNSATLPVGDTEVRYWPQYGEREKAAATAK